jgi:YVTN family beta-propeller protein
MVDDQWLGAELAGYRIERLIGRGGAGVVYRATHLRLHRPAAVKVLAVGLAVEAEYRRRFEREARLAAGLEHEHIVPIYDAGYAQDRLFLAMRYIEGPNLATVIDNDGPLGLRDTCELLAGIANALDSAHQAGLVHRDVKPANILIATPEGPTRRRHAYLCDFGIARHAATSSTLTATGQVLGTLQYCAPEQIQGQPVDGRADQYALACVVFHCLTGRVPYPADEPSAVMFAHISAEPPRASAHNPTLPPAVDDIIARALAKQPAQRFPDCATFLHALAGTNNVASPAVTPQPSPTSPTPHTVIWPPRSDQPPTPSTTTNQDHERGSPTGLRNRPFLIEVIVLLGIVAFAVSVVIGLAVGYSESPNPSPGSPTQVTDADNGSADRQPWETDLIPLPPDPASGVLIDGGLAITPDGRHAYSVGLRSVSVIDIASNEVIATIPAPSVVGGQVAIAPDGRHAYVTKNGTNDSFTRSDPDYASVVVIDTAIHAISATIATPGLPRGVAFTPDGRHAYVTVRTDTTSGSYVDSVVVIDTGSNAVSSVIPIGDPTIGMSGAVAVSPDGRHAYVSGSHSIAVIDTAKNEQAARIKLTSAGSLSGIVVNPDGRHVYATASGPGDSVAVHVVDTATNAVTATISDPRLRRTEAGIAIAPDGGRVYVSIDGTSSALVVIDTMSNAVATMIPISGCIRGAAAIAPDGHHAYITCDRSVAVIETGA